MEERQKGNMEINRKPFQGVANIIRFNWHFYLLALGAVLLLLLLSTLFGDNIRLYIYVSCTLVFSSMLLSLLASMYIYDVSDLYQLNWIDKTNKDITLVNIHAGFDETSSILMQSFELSNMQVFDFYDPIKHTEVSIKRARKAYPPFPNTQSITTAHIPLQSDSVDKIVVILSAHEIRDEVERIFFFNELARIVKPYGNIYVTEHLCDIPNFLVYNIGFLHFHSSASWQRTFKQTNLTIQKEIKTTPFISTYILNKNGITH